MKITSETQSRTLLIGGVIAALIVGVVGGYFAAHLGMADMPGMTTGKGGVSAPPGRVGEKESMEMGAKQGMGNMKDTGAKSMQGMEGMPGMSTAPTGTIVIPAVTRQLIGVRTAPVSYAPLAQEIRAVGTVEYDERKLTKVNLRVSGWIQQVFINAIGQSVHAGQPMLTLYSPHLLATQDEYLLALKAQAQLEDRPLAESTQHAAALVAYIYPYLDEATRTVRVRMEFPNPHLKLKPGMYGNVMLHVDSGRRLVVPKEAVLDSGLRKLVFLDLGQGVYQPYPVKLGRRSQDYVEVLEGIKEGDRVVTSANFLMDAESKLASAGGMQAMMGQIGMADWQMRGSREAKMAMGEGGVSAPPGREGEKGMKGMEGMEGMK